MARAIWPHVPVASSLMRPLTQRHIFRKLDRVRRLVFSDEGFIFCICQQDRCMLLSIQEPHLTFNAAQCHPVPVVNVDHSTNAAVQDAGIHMKRLEGQLIFNAAGMAHRSGGDGMRHNFAGVPAGG